MNIITVNNLTKSYLVQKREQGIKGTFQSLFNRKHEKITAVSNINFQIEKGEIVGYLGPNGAGKSTTIKMLSGILSPTNGNIDVNGLSPFSNRKEHSLNIGVVFGQRTQLWWDIPVSESLNLMRHMYKIPKSDYLKRLEVFNEFLDLNQFINVPVRQLSLGQRMRADLCAALLHQPEVLFLDEPTIGLDVVVKDNIRTFIQQINENLNTTVILTTHDMSDIEKLCNRVIVIDQGSKVYDGTVKELKKTYGSEELIIVETENKIKDYNYLFSPGILYVEQQNNTLFITYNKSKISSSVILKILMNKEEILDFTIKETEIDEVIRRMYIKSLNPISAGGAMNE
ncbi:ABC transporter [Gracilibacillus halophilus YIM-C55.5]|uniref:ABC transporter n=1 Tax=Gracilibacillus halophilus YIM-C55.5 TaxID=1308866 RepID=N4W8T9_9BACI|nr:ATP-binding cassette domain-containing protein [Gracilibacillus halophilus]ENH95629.1 ABC transporter [Gracilibacillus halophilus YIM-C55.5]